MGEVNYRSHGKAPYSVVVVHGGPGAPGGMAFVAQKLSKMSGVIEPFQTSQTIRGQIEELHSAVIENCQLPVVMIGHSWGAWLSFMLAAEFPGDVSKLVLVGAGPFEKGASVTDIRLNRLNNKERTEALELMKLLGNSDKEKLYPELFRRFAELISIADIFDPVEMEDDTSDFQPEIYKSIWPDADKIRREGRLLKLGEKIQCPVVAIHGDYDPHPAEGVREPLQRSLKDFKFILLKDCGHYPWKEKKAAKDFFEILFHTLA